MAIPEYFLILLQNYDNLKPNAMGKFGATELILILVLIIILFGAKKLPDLMRGAGRGIREFKDAMNKDYSTEKDTDKTSKKEDDVKDTSK